MQREDLSWGVDFGLPTNESPDVLVGDFGVVSWCAPIPFGCLAKFLPTHHEHLSNAEILELPCDDDPTRFERNLQFP